MMKIRKTALLVLSAAALALIFTACAADPDLNTDQATYGLGNGVGYGQEQNGTQGLGQEQYSENSGDCIVAEDISADDSTPKPSPEPAPASEAAGYGSAGALAADEMTLEDMLTYTIQDEYLARAEYQYILDAFGSQRPFSNIVKAEQTHIAELTPLFDRYGYALPADDSAQYLAVPANVREALETGVQAEINNIAMYDTFLGKDMPDDVRSVFEELRDASENHLNAFTTALNNRYR